MKRMISLACILAMLAACFVLPGFADEDAEQPVLIGYQFSEIYQNQDGENVRNIRFVAAGNDRTYTAVGFDISAPEYEGKAWNKSSNLVFASLNATDSDGAVAKVRAQDYGAEYLYAFVVKGVPAEDDITFSVMPYATSAEQLQVNGERKTVVIRQSADASTGAIYPILEDATEYIIDGETYTVVRTLEELKEVFSANVQNARVILGAHIDGAGGSIAGGGLKVGAGSVIEGNNYTISNFSGNSIFNLENGAQIEIRNLQFGTEEQPLELTGGLVAAYTRCVSRWENVRIYANLTASSGNKGVWFDAANGSHTFVNCETHAAVNGGRGNVGAWFGQTNEAGCSIRFEGCSIYGSVTGTNNAGSIIGYMSGPIYMKDCINYADISGAQNAGGFVAHDTVDTAAAMYFENCANYGTVTASNANGTAGGFCGQDRRPGTYLNCANYGTIKSGAANNIKAGGLLGQKDGTGSTMTNCVNYGSIEARGTIGGIVGSITGMLTCSGCVNAADVTMLESGDHAGGFVGWAVNVTLDHCANIGAITSIGSSSGNLIGKPNAYTITDCYGFGIVSGGSNGVLIGAVNDGVTGTSTGNKYLNGNQAGTIGAEEQGLVATVAEAVELLEAYYADLTFEIVDGAIVIRPAA